ncbi:MAG: FkbM family methyltransferase [bacterium]|jgi:hypothetical protein
MKLFRKILKFLSPSLQLNFSQFGEDLIISHLFNQLNIKNPSYLDLGANEPRFISNTYFFYLRGSSGVLIEPNRYLYRKNKSVRPRDIVLNVGVGAFDIPKADFYLFPNFANGLSTFSKSEAMHWSEVGMKGIGKINIKEVVQVPILSINSILENHFQYRYPNFVSLDIEGLDFDILKAFDFDKYKPEVFCVETMGYDENGNTYKKNEIIDYMISKEYFVYADTRVNTIFVLKNIL